MDLNYLGATYRGAGTKKRRNPAVRASSGLDTAWLFICFVFELAREKPWSCLPFKSGRSLSRTLRTRRLILHNGVDTDGGVDMRMGSREWADVMFLGGALGDEPPEVAEGVFAGDQSQD